MKASIIVVVKNEAVYIKSCLEALLNQSYQQFEIIVVDNGSTDSTGEIIKALGNKRLKYIYEPSNPGIADLRNIAVKQSLGEHIFFTDGDCIASKYWLEEGLRILETKPCVGVEGKTFYESRQKITIADYNIYQFGAGEFMTCNIAYKRDVLEKINYFDSLFKRGFEDRDLALRAMKYGKIYYSPDMLVAHQRKKLTPRALFARAKRTEDLIRLIKKHGLDKQQKYGLQNTKTGNILYPKKLLIILCPPLLILTERYTTPGDLLLGFLKYVSYIYERLLIWKSALKNRVLVI